MNSNHTWSSGRFRRLVCLFLTPVLVGVVHAPLVAGDWPQFRGPQGDGTSTETSVFPRGEAFGLRIAWKRATGSGYSGVVIAGGHVVTMFSDGKSDVAVALDEKTGRERWRFEIEATHKGHDGSHTGPISTPVIDAGRVFGLSARGRLFALDVETGSLVWSVDLVKEHEAVKPHYGFGTSPVVQDGVLVVQIGAKGAAIAGFDPATGKRLWATGDDGIGYQSPIPYEIGGRRHVLAAASKNLFGVDAKSGEVIWKHAHGGAGAQGASALVPVPVGPGRLFLGHRDEASTVIKLKRADDAVSIETAWEERSIRKSYSVPVYHDGHIYAYSTRFLTCVDVETGKAVWRSRPPGDGFPILVDGHLVIIAKRGSLHVAKATPEGYREVANRPLFDDLAWSPPSFANGHIVVRGMGEIARVGVQRGAAVVRAESRPGSDVSGTTLAKLVADVKAAPDKKAVVDRFMAAQKSFPILDGKDRVHFVYRGPGEDLAIEGDMIGARREHAMTRIDGTDVFYYSIRLEPDARVNYLLVRDYEEITDPRNPRRTKTMVYTKNMEMAFGGGEMEMSWVSMPKWRTPAHLKEAPESRRGRVETHELESKVLKTKHTINVYLPVGYDPKGDRRYPVAYVFGGQAARQRGEVTKTLDNLIGRSIEPIIVVFIHHMGFGKTDANADMLAGELVPFIGDKYAAVDSADARAVIGSGFPAFEALYCAFKHPDVVRKVGTQSTLMMDMMRTEFDERVKSHSGKPLTCYVEWGKYDLRNPHEAWDMAEINREFAGTLRSRGHVVRGGEVNDGTGWSSWRNRTDRLFESLFPLKRTGT